jgi:hypothetical protein
LDKRWDVSNRLYIMDWGAVVVEGPIADLHDHIVKRHLTV